MLPPPPLPQAPEKDLELKVTESQLLFKRYVALWHRQVQYPNGKVVNWDVVGHLNAPHPTFCVVFPYDSKTKTTTLCREYAQGPHRLLYTFAAGAYEPLKHKSLLASAESEMHEELKLKGGQLIPLLPIEHPGISELKWGNNTFLPFLCLDPEIDINAPEGDHEEYMEVIKDVKLEQVKDLIMKGEVMLPSVQTFFMGYEYLKENNLL